MFNKHVFNGKYRYGLFFYSKILFYVPLIPQWFTVSAAEFVTELLQKDPKTRLGWGTDGAQDVKDHPFFDVSPFPMPVTR
jgi:hypothetical protein